jgi:hypothetical protein
MPTYTSTRDITVEGVTFFEGTGNEVDRYFDTNRYDFLTLTADTPANPKVVSASLSATGASDAVMLDEGTGSFMLACTDLNDTLYLQC